MGARRLTLFLLLLATPLARATDVLSYHNNLQSTGQNLTETKLTPGSVALDKFQRRFVLPLDGQAYAQPLYKAGVAITAGAQAGPHDAVFVATQHGSIYAVDALSGVILWQTSLLSVGLADAVSISTVPNADVNTPDIAPEIGIVSTPVIDPATGFLYATCKTKQFVAGDSLLPRFVYTIFKLDIATGAIAGSHIIAATYKPDVYIHRTELDPYVLGTGNGASTVNDQSRVYFNAQWQMNRPGLVLLDGEIYAAFGSHADNGPYHGWLLAFDAQTLEVTRVFNTTPNGGLAGIWQSGGIPVVDAAGYIYVNTGNGSFDGGKDAGGATIGLNGQGFPVGGNYGNCFLKLARDPASTIDAQNINGWGLKVVDYFCPFNTQNLNTTDSDLGSGGPIVLPDEVGSATHPRLLIGAGKEGKIYLLDRDQMGKFDANTDHVVQTQGNAITGCVNTPAYFDGKLYWVGGYSTDQAKIFAIGNASFSGTPLSFNSRTYSFPGATPSISANGLANAVVWTLERSSNELRAYDATDLSHELWTSALSPNDRDKLGSVVKFTVPTVADGLVFVGTMDALVVYGPPLPPTAGPLAPTGLTAAAASGLQVNLSWQDKATNEDGFDVEQSSDAVSFTKVATLGVNENTASVIGLQPDGFYYFRVRAFNSFNGTSYSGYSNVAGIGLQGQLPSLNFASGFSAAAAVLQLAGAAKYGQAAEVQLTDGAAAQTGAIWTKTMRNVARFTTEFTFRANGSAEGLTFCAQRLGAKSLGAGGAGLGYAGLKNSIALKFDLAPGLSSTGFYSRGTAPGEDVRAVDLAPSGIDFHSGHLFRVLITYNKGVLALTILDTEGPGSFTKSYVVNLPTLLGGTTAYLGFTGAGDAAQSIHSWTYAPLPALPPTAPFGLTAKAASGTQLNLSWRDASGSEAGFVIERRTPPGANFGMIGVVGPNVTAYMDTALTPLQPYDYRVRASNAAGLSAPTLPLRAKTPVPPVTPSNATAQFFATKIVLRWKDNAANESRYAILRKAGDDGEFKPIVANLPPNTTSYVDSDVASGTAYDYHIQCLNVAGYSDFAGVSVTTP
jgi:hypothetical protein